MINAILASTSTVHGSSYLEYLEDELKTLFKDCNEVLFIPYARPDGLTYDEYTSKAEGAFKKIGIELVGIHKMANPVQAIKNARGIFTGGGNTFLLLKTLHDLKIFSDLKTAILQGTPYLGTSAGSNICGQTIGTTNDMPIVYPPSFDGLGIVNFNINPHYLEKDPKSTHMGESRETRIKEFLHFNSIPVIGLKEGSFLKVNGSEVMLKGPHSAIMFHDINQLEGIQTNNKLPDFR